MQEQNAVMAQLATLSEEVYFRQDQSVATTIPLTVLSSGFKGLALAAPRIIRLDTHNTLPALLVTGESKSRSAAFPLSQNALLIAADIDSGKVISGEAFPGDPSKSPPDDKPPGREKPKQEKSSARPDPDAEGDGDMAGTAWLDFRKLLDISWRPARLALRVIAFDEVSNPVFVTLESEQTIGIEFFPPDVAAEVVRRNKTAEELGRGLPKFVRSRETPRLKSSGVALALETDRARPGTSLPVHGALRLELSFQSIVRRRQDSATREANGGPDLPAAVVKATLLVTIMNRDVPARIDLNIPVWSDHKLQFGEEIEAAFSLDLATALPMEFVPGEYCIYLVAGPYLSGPHKLVIQPNRWRR